MPKLSEELREQINLYGYHSLRSFVGRIEELENLAVEALEKIASGDTFYEAYDPAAVFQDIAKEALAKIKEAGR